MMDNTTYLNPAGRVACIPSSWLLPPIAQSWDHWLLWCSPFSAVSWVSAQAGRNYRVSAPPPTPDSCGFREPWPPNDPPVSILVPLCLTASPMERGLASPGASEKPRLHQHWKGLLCGCWPLLPERWNSSKVQAQVRLSPGFPGLLPPLRVGTCCHQRPKGAFGADPLSVVGHSLTPLFHVLGPAGPPPPHLLLPKKCPM